MIKHAVSLGIAGLALAVATPVVTAVPITFEFEGVINDSTGDPLGCLTSGNDFTGSYTFESTTLDQNGSPNVGSYPQLGSNTMTLTFNVSCDFTFTYDITVENDLPDDAYRLENNETIDAGAFDVFVNIDLIDADGLVFSNDDLPLTPPDLSFFEDLIDGNIVLVGGESKELPFFEFEGEITMLTPEPTAISLLALAGLALLRRRRG